MLLNVESKKLTNGYTRYTEADNSFEVREEEGQAENTKTATRT